MLPLIILAKIHDSLFDKPCRLPYSLEGRHLQDKIFSGVEKSQRSLTRPAPFSKFIRIWFNCVIKFVRWILLDNQHSPYKEKRLFGKRLFGKWGHLHDGGDGICAKIVRHLRCRNDWHCDLMRERRIEIADFAKPSLVRRTNQPGSRLLWNLCN